MLLLFNTIHVRTINYINNIMKIITALIFFICVNLSLFAQSSEYKIVNRFHVDGDEGWDMIAVDESTARIFVSHGSMAQVIDELTGTLLGTISDLKGVHGFAFATDLNKGFISCGRDSSTVVFDLKTLSVTDKIKMTGGNADAIIYDLMTKRVFVFNGSTGNATVVDANTNSIVGTITLDGKPEFAVTDGAGKIYVNLEDKSMVDVINSTTMQVVQSWSVAPGEEPTGIALDNENHLLFSACGNKLMVVSDAVSGKIVSAVPIGERVDGADFDPVTKRAFSPNGEGSLTVIQIESKDKFTVIETAETQRGARTIALDKMTHHIFMSTAEYDPAPEPTPENPKPRPKIRPGTFVILDIMSSK